MASEGEPKIIASAAAAAAVGREEDDPIVVFMRYFIGHILPYGVVFGSVMLKVPQIVKVLQHRSAAGISLASLCFELTSYVITTSWGIAQALQFKDFGENMFIMLEMALLLLLVGYLQNNLLYAMSVFLAEATALAAMSTGFLDRDLHEWLLSVQILFGMSSRVPQIIMNYRNESTGQLSFATFYLAMMGGISRLLTTFHNVPVEKGRHVMLTQFSISVGLNVAIIIQILQYRKNTKAVLNCGKEKKTCKENKKNQ
ncbi:putative SNF2 DNA repair protein [Trypanosoma grayi]|uniref:putative SNF2 DNA repair protein n=1 Tax=Trypanosoma grayi TaxID=71804 RepID=UPI0004F4B6C6|nr:putative SNF2 DNA repair protein [Trypanosoma grayi]KEG08407.1 putative SNF2 DNA repair protein [Trypanosoma grayi]